MCVMYKSTFKPRTQVGMKQQKKMSTYIEPHFIKCTEKPPDQRTPENLQSIYTYLHDLEALRSLREPALREIAKTVRYEKRDANDTLYCRDDLSTCWYILLTGSVFIDQAMYLPRSSFGKRTSGSGRRGTDCLLLETSELLVIDYPDAQFLHPGQRQSCSSTNLERLMALEHDELKVQNSRGRSVSEDRNIQQSYSDSETALPVIRLERTQSLDSEQKHSMKNEDVQSLLGHLDPNKRSYLPIAVATASTASMSSDRSSIHSSISSSYSDIFPSGENPDLDLSGLVESTVDSDDEESSETGSLLVRDFVRDCLEKDPMDRTEDEIEILLDFMRNLPAFANMTMSVRRALCAVMVFAVVAKAGTVVMKDGEELDSWSVILNGHVEISSIDGTVEQLHLGDSFGVKPVMDAQYHHGVMRTTIDDCQFVCIAQEHYFRILTQGEENIRRIEENGELVMVTEHRVLDDRRQGHVVIKAKPEKLTCQLMEDHSSVDPTYVEDFLMTYRSYLHIPQSICNLLLHWFEDVNLRSKVTRVVLLWVNNYYNDFESSPDMIEFLEAFEDFLEQNNMMGQLRLLHIAGAAKAKPRTVVLARSDRDSLLSFSIVGGWEKRMGIFISKVEKGSKAQEVGLRKGDQLLEVNCHNFEHTTRSKALEILKGTTHLSITVKYNTLAFRDLLATQDGRHNNWGRRPSQEISLLQSDPRARLNLAPEMGIGLLSAKLSPEIKDTKATKAEQKKMGFATLGKRDKLKKAMAKLSILPNKANVRTQDDTSTVMKRSPSGSLGSNPYLSNSNPDLSSISSLQSVYEQPQYYTSSSSNNGHRETDCPEHVLKIYRADQSCKYFLVHKETTANEIVMLSMREFGLTDPGCLGVFSLCEVTVSAEGVVKQRRLPDHQTNIAGRLSVNGRLFLRNNMASETLMPDEVAVELVKDSSVSFLQLDSIEVAVQLTLRDYEIFKAIESTDYIDDLFELKPKPANERLKKFEELVNLEMFWVIGEVCSEQQIVKRAKIIKQFIRIARHCKDCKNFNSLFAIISGLGHGSVSRLHNTWDKIPNKYTKMFEDLQNLMDPSRNMSKYRNLVNAEHVQPPLIPFFPVVKKDLTFIHLGNDSKVDGLINFEKLRMIAKEVRYITSMGAVRYNPKHLLERNGNNTSSSSLGFASMSSLQGTATLQRKHRGGRRTSTIINPKKMWEEAQMARRVKQYLASQNINKDEDKLREMSLICEPLPNQGPSNVGTLPRKSVQQANSTENISPVPPRQASPNRQEEKIKQLIYKDAPKTTFGATSPKHLRKLLSLSEEGDKRSKNMKLERVTKSMDLQKGYQSPPISPMKGRSPRTRKQGVSATATATTIAGINKYGIVHDHRNVATRRLSPQRSDSGYAGSDAGSSSSRTTEQDVRRRHTVASGPPPSAFLGGAASYDSDSSHYDTQSNSSFGSSSSPPTRDHRYIQDLTRPLAAVDNHRPLRRTTHEHPHLPPEYHCVSKVNPPTNKPAPKLYSPPPQEMSERKQPPVYEVAAARARAFSGNSQGETCDYYDSDDEQVSVV